MKKAKWMVGLVAVALALAAIAPHAVKAAPRDNVWSVGDNTNKILKDGTLKIEKPLEITANSTLSAVEESDTIINTAAYLVVTSSGGVVTLTGTPTVSTTTAAGIALVSGKTITIRGTSNTDAVVLQDDDTLSGSQLELGASSRSLGLNDTLVLLWDASTSSTGRWLELSFSNLD